MGAITTVELIMLTVVSAATPLLLAATGELVAEKSGVLLSLIHISEPTRPY